MNLAQMNALANSSTGLVAMEIKRSFAPWRKGEIAGFPPETALAHFQEGVAVVYGYDVEGQFRPVAASDYEPASAEDDGLPVQPKAKVIKAQKGKPTIPDDWASLHALKKIKLAKDLGWVKPKKDDVPEGITMADLAHSFLQQLVPKMDQAASATQQIQDQQS